MLKNYVRPIKAATSDLIKNWVLIPLSFALLYAHIQSIYFFSQFGQVGGFIHGLVEIAIFTYYYSLLQQVLHSRRITRQDFAQFDWGLFNSIIGAAFVIYLARFIIASFSMGSDSATPLFFFDLAVFFLLNAMPEFIYIECYDGFVAIKESIAFLKERSLEWFLPFIVLLLPWIIFFHGVGIENMVIESPLLPSRSLYPSLVLGQEVLVFSILTTSTSAKIGFVVLGLALVQWFTLFRAHLFEHLRSRRM